jgi:hypothetical protein
MKIGVTGHQNLGGRDVVAWLGEEIRAVLEDAKLPEGFTCLARGADQLYAEILLRKSLPYTFVQPCRKYESTFTTAEDLADFRRLHREAAHVVEMPFQDPSESAFLSAGQFIVDNSELMIAVWDGCPAKGLGGTADIVRYAASKRKTTVHLNPVTRLAIRLS